MWEVKRCDNCNRMLENGDKVTVILSDIEVAGSYRKGHDNFRLKLSPDAIGLRAAKIYCKKCLNIQGHFLTQDHEK